MIGRAHSPVACPNCGRKDRFAIVGQQVSIDAARLTSRLEHVIVACICKRAFDVARGSIIEYQPQPDRVAEPDNGKPATPEPVDSDLPIRFRGRA